ncbi:MAG: hypothetical protein BroJett030_26060 [Alphaproteobacteria bacterium]|nr:MAG: hypothetical protein BroJett030_26060 [Alphaproteobacteria bacterium]
MPKHRAASPGCAEMLPFAFGVALAAGCAPSLLSFGRRGTFGLFTAPLSEARGWGRRCSPWPSRSRTSPGESASPLAGIVVDRRGAAPVAAVGGLLYALDLAAAPLADTPAMLRLTVGVLTVLGMGGAPW